jgi:hypothetical protein
VRGVGTPAAQPFGEIDLVGAADHRLGIVDHRHAFLLGAPGEAVGEVVDRGGGADEQRVVFGQPVEVALVDRLDLDGELLRHLGEMAQAGLGRRRMGLARIDQDGERVFGLAARLGIAPGAPGMVVERAGKERPLVGAQRVDAGRRDALQMAAPVVQTGRDPEHRHPEPVEQQPCEGHQRRVLDLSEAHEQLERTAGAICALVEASPSAASSSGSACS